MAPPSLVSRLANIITWVVRLRRLAPIAALSQELVRFDVQLLQDAEIRSIEYQQGELAGYEVREYLLEKWAPSLRLLQRNEGALADRTYDPAQSARLQPGE
jgi:hypothetical protein